MPPTVGGTDREELRRKLRDKINGKRSQSGNNSDGAQLARRMKDDPTTTMLSLGVDDPTLLGLAKTISKNPEAALRDLTTLLPATKEIAQPVLDQVHDTHCTDEEEAPPGSDEEEAPPGSDEGDAPPKKDVPQIATQ